MIILYLLAVYGLTNIVVNEKVFRKPVKWLRRNNTILNDILSCPTCFAFYVGVVMFFLIPITLSGILSIDILLSGIIASGVVNIIEEIKTKMM